MVFIWSLFLLFSVAAPIFGSVVLNDFKKCPLNEFRCGDGECVGLDRICDGISDCSDTSDEECTGNVETSLSFERLKRQTTQCRKNQWQCRDRSCISFDGKCDGVVDCRDGSDETFALCRNNTCQLNWFRCTYGACVDGTAPCNDVQECADNSDELLPRCRNDTNGALGQFFCDNGQVVLTSDVCDGVKNCADGSDETLRTCAGKTCPSYQFQCAYGACADQDSNCNGVEDCADGSDETLELCRPDEAVYVTSTTTSAPVQAGNCILPAYPLHGTYTVGGDTKARPGDAYVSALLNYSCSLGYGLDTENSFTYCQGGTWYGEIPKCVRLCRLNKHPSVEYRCLISGPNGEEGSRDCNLHEPVGTIVRPDCRKPNYYSPVPLSLMRCQEGGWDTYPICAAGVLRQGTNITLIIKDAVQIYVSQFQYGGDGQKTIPVIVNINTNNLNTININVPQVNAANTNIVINTTGIANDINSTANLTGAANDTNSVANDSNSAANDSAVNISNFKLDYSKITFPDTNGGNSQRASKINHSVEKSIPKIKTNEYVSTTELSTDDNFIGEENWRMAPPQK